MRTPSDLILNRLSLTVGSANVVDDITATFRAGSVTAIVGANGAGKTTLFNVICGFVQPSSGGASWASVRLNGRTPDRIARLGLGRTFQSPRVFRSLSASANAQVACVRGFAESWMASLVWPLLGNRSEQAACREARRCIELVGLTHCSDRVAGELSFGQQKLLAFAAVVGTGARCLLLDEPTSGLDPDAADRVLTIVRSLARNGTTVVVIEHNRQAVARFCDRVLVMDRGRIVSEANPSDVPTTSRLQTNNYRGAEETLPA